MIYNNIAIILVIVLHMTNGVPLEPESPDYSSYFQSSRIVGGEDAPEAYLSYQVALIFGGYFRSLICGGSIVSRQHVLSAAHCIDPLVSWWTGELMTSAKAIVGSTSWESGGTEVQFKSYYNHPKWNSYTIKNDIGVLTLSKKLDYDIHVGPVALSYRWVDGGEKSYVTGWGLTSAWGELPIGLQLLYVWTISPKECTEGIEAAAAQFGSAPPHDPAVEICTYHSTGYGMCNGDSGSALISIKDMKQIALVSWGFACAKGFPDVYTRIAPYKDFMDKALNEDSSH